MSILALLSTEDRLWIGFSASKGGGLGYLDLARNKFVGTMPELPPEAVLPREQRGDRSVSRDAGAPPRGQIAAFGLAPSGVLWAALPGGAVRFTGPPSNKWERLLFESRLYYTVLAASDRFLVFARQHTGSASSPTDNGVLIYDLQSKKYRTVTFRDGLPNDNVRSVALDGEVAWVGGSGFLAVVDLPSGKVKKICKLRAIFGVGCLEVAGNQVWFCAGPALYRMPKDAR